jgi:hypothetical protein
MMRNVRRPYRKRYEPQGADVFDPQVITGRAIKHGATVTVTAHYGVFRIVRDEQGNQMSVGRGSLKSLREEVQQ